MRRLRFVLKIVAAASLLLAAFAITGGKDWFAEADFGMSGRAEPASASGKTEAPPETAAPASSASASSPEVSSSLAAAEPEAPASAAGESEQPAAPQPKETAAADAPALATRDLVRLAAAAPQIPAPSLAHIPGLVLKFAPAKILFGAVNAPTPMASRSIGFYAKGCLAGAKPLPVDGPAWQAMRLSRNRMWGHPTLVRYIERFAKDAKAKDGWPGLLVGDMSLPRGGPMPFGHSSHQVGLDVDIWYKPMPERTLSAAEREKIPMESFLLDPAHVNPAVWTPDYVKLLRRAVSYPEVTRIFVNPAIKKWLCVNVKEDRDFLRKIHPIVGHDDHFHVRLKCPANNPGCRNQPDRTADEGCDKNLDAWIARLSKEKPSASPFVIGPRKIPLRASKANRLVTVEQLPPDCRRVLQTPAAVAAR